MRKPRGPEARDRALNDDYSTLEDFIARESDDVAFAELFADARARRGLVELLVRLRKSQEISGRDLARAMEISPASVSEFENHSTDPHLSSVQRYARAIGCEVTFVVRSSSVGEAYRARNADLAATIVSERIASFVTRDPSQLHTAQWAAANSKVTDFARAA